MDQFLSERGAVPATAAARRLANQRQRKSTSMMMDNPEVRERLERMALGEVPEDEDEQSRPMVIEVGGLERMIYNSDPFETEDGKQTFLAKPYNRRILEEQVRAGAAMELNRVFGGDAASKEWWNGVFCSTLLSKFQISAEALLDALDRAASASSSLVNGAVAQCRGCLRLLQGARRGGGRPRSCSCD